MKNYIGKFSEKEGTEDILTGQINKNKIDLPQTTLNFLSNIKRPNNIKNDLILSEMTTEEYISTFRKSNEYTTSSPSGVHYFHYMAASFDQELAAIMALKIYLPFQFAFKVDRWSREHHIIIPKTDPPHLHKLRNIQIIEDDFNSYFKCKINKQLFRNEKVLKLLQKKMYGGIKNKSSHLEVVNQMLINDYINLTKSSVYNTQYDAANLFDRMAPNIVAVALMRLGTPKEIGYQIARNSINTSHKIMSNGNISQSEISCDQHKIWSGIGKGNSVAAPDWIALESAMIETYKCQYTQFSAVNPTNITQYSNPIIAYVDDNNTSHIFPSHTTTEEIIQKIMRTQ